MDRNDSNIKKIALCILLGAVILFSGITIGSLKNIEVVGGDLPAVKQALGIGSNAVQQTTVPGTSTLTPTVAPTAAPTAAPTTAAPASTDPAVPTSPADSTGTTAAPVASGALSSSSSVAEIVAYFNTSANKVKTDATKVTRNYENLFSNPEYLQVPSAVTSIASMAMDKFLTKNETPVEYASQADIIANYPVKGQTWVSQITPDQIDTATCEDDGTNYNITLNFKDDTTNVNPTFGVGYGTAFNLMLEEEVALDYPGLTISNIKITYHNGVIKCTIDKATGNVIASNYSMPMILSLTAKIVFSEVDAQIGMTFEHDYSITY